MLLHAKTHAIMHFKYIIFFLPTLKGKYRDFYFAIEEIE